ncbi:MAG: hypothetical protein ACFCUN_03955 [Hyphomicrobiaceae bacterium]
MLKTLALTIAAAAALALSPLTTDANANSLAAGSATAAASISAEPTLQHVGFRGGRRFGGVHVHIGRHHRPHFGYGYVRPYHYVAPVVIGCGFEKARWHQTGSHYWKKRYYICRGWW